MVFPSPTLPRSSPPPHPHNYMTHSPFCRKQADKSKSLKNKEITRNAHVYEQPKAKSMKTQNIKP